MDRAICNDTPPDLSQKREILIKLLDIELNRLETAVKIEKERKIVFPETSIIIHDIQRLNEALNKKSRDDNDCMSITDLV